MSEAKTHYLTLTEGERPMPTRDPSQITKSDALCVLSVVGRGLSNGKGEPVPGRMCVEAAVCYAMGEPHDDAPQCVDDELREEKIALNDMGGWSGPKARSKALTRIAIAQLGSRGNFSFSTYNRSLARQFDEMRLAQWRKAHAKTLATLASKTASAQAIDAASTSFEAFMVTDDGMGIESLVDELSTFTGEHYNNKVFAMAAEMMVQACIEQKIPGTRYLHLVKSSTRMTLAQIEAHRQRRAKSQ